MEKENKFISWEDWFELQRLHMRIKEIGDKYDTEKFKKSLRFFNENYYFIWNEKAPISIIEFHDRLVSEGYIEPSVEMPKASTSNSIPGKAGSTFMKQFKNRVEINSMLKRRFGGGEIQTDSTLNSDISFNGFRWKKDVTQAIFLLELLLDNQYILKPKGQNTYITFILLFDLGKNAKGFDMNAEKNYRSMRSDIEIKLSKANQNKLGKLIKAQ